MISSFSSPLSLDGSPLTLSMAFSPCTVRVVMHVRGGESLTVEGVTYGKFCSTAVAMVQQVRGIDALVQ